MNYDFFSSLFSPSFMADLKFTKSFANALPKRSELAGTEEQKGDANDEKDLPKSDLAFHEIPPRDREKRTAGTHNSATESLG